MSYKRGDWIPSDKSILCMLLRLPLQLIPKETIIPILRTAVRGKKWILGSGAHSQWLGFHEVGKKKLFQKTIQPGSTVYDIGANVGIYTILSSVLCGNSGKVYAFEPDQHNLKYLRDHVKLNNLQNVSIVEYAISKKSCRLFFQATSDHCTSHISDDGNMEINAVSIDDFVFEQDNIPPDFLKIDVEGAESLVIEGAQRTLEEYRPEIFLAIHGYEIDQICRRQLENLNYKLTNVPGYDDEIYTVHE